MFRIARRYASCTLVLSLQFVFLLQGNTVSKFWLADHAATSVINHQLKCFELKELMVTCKLLLQAYFDTAGHWLYIEQPEAFNDLVLQFVSKA